MSARAINAPPLDPPVAVSASPSLLVRHERWVFATLLLVFLLGLLGTLKQLERYHGDERYYTDAAIMMLQSGDWLSPRYADGGGRFNKPLLTYWIMCASYKLLGVSMFSSRLPFLIAGCCVIWLTWKLGRVLFADAESALLGAVFMAANIQTMTISTRSTPDIFLCLFVTASLCGFAKILVRKECGNSAYALAYMGAGLACATKGMLGVIPVLFALALWQIAYRRELPLRAVLPLGWLLAGAVVGLSSFLLVTTKHGPGNLLMFFKDQTAIDVRPGKWFLLGNLADYIGAVIRHFLPWTLLVAASCPAAWPATKEFIRTRRPQLQVALGWFAAVVGIFVFAFVRRTRYLMPAYPCIAAVLGAVFVVLLRQQKAHLWIRRLMVFLAILGCIAVIVPAILGWRFDARLTGSLGLALTACGAIAYARKDVAASAAILGVWIVMAFSALVIFWWPLLESAPAHTLTRELLARGADRPIAAIGVPPAVTAQIRVLSGGVLNPQSVASARDVPLESLLIATEQAREALAAAGYELLPAGYIGKASKPKDMLRSLRSGHFVSGKTQTLYIAVRPSKRNE